MFDNVEVEVIEEGRYASQETDAFDTAGFGLIEEGLDEEAACSVTLCVRTNDDGADLSEVLAVNVECCTANELLRDGLDDGEGADVRTDLCVAPWKQGAIVGEAVD
jgi:hypothetical protein